MRIEIKDRFNDTILRAALDAYGVEGDNYSALDGFESFIFNITVNHRELILRIGHSGRRDERYVRGEADWINHLSDGGASVARAIEAKNGELVISLPDGEGAFFVACAFEKAKGKPAWEYGWKPEIYKQHGRMLGKIHSLSKEYSLKDPKGFRPQWNDPNMIEVDEVFPDSNHPIRKANQIINHRLNTLEKDKPAYGLIHFDAHPGNFFMAEDGRLTLFDFDDCHYNWYINDIAIVLFYMVMNSWDSNTEIEFTQKFMSNFLAGYAEENKLDPKWLQEITYFLKMREIDLYAIILRDFDIDNLEDEPWVARYLKDRKERIEKGIPYIDFDWESLASYLK